MLITHQAKMMYAVWLLAQTISALCVEYSPAQDLPMQCEFWVVPHVLCQECASDYIALHAMLSSGSWNHISDHLWQKIHMQVLMSAAAPVKSLLVSLTEHQSMQSDVPVAVLSCKAVTGKAGSTACINKFWKWQGHGLLASLWSFQMAMAMLHLCSKKTLCHAWSGMVENISLCQDFESPSWGSNLYIPTHRDVLATVSAFGFLFPTNVHSLSIIRLLHENFLGTLAQLSLFSLTPSSLNVHSMSKWTCGSSKLWVL